MKSCQKDPGLEQFILGLKNCKIFFSKFQAQAQGLGSYWQEFTVKIKNAYTNKFLSQSLFTR